MLRTLVKRDRWINNKRKWEWRESRVEKKKWAKHFNRILCCMRKWNLHVKLERIKMPLKNQRWVLAHTFAKLLFTVLTVLYCTVLYCTAAVRCCNVDVLNTQCTTLLCFGLLLNVVERIASRSQMNRQNNCNGICASDVSIRILNHKLNACFMLKDLFGWICW